MIIITTTILFLTCFLAILMQAIAAQDNEIIIKCLHNERLALLDFKAMLFGDSGNCFSWENGKDCCEWKGVQCDNRTNHVVALDLSGAYLQGKMISPSLLELVHLKHLDLSYIYFYESQSQIPEFIGSLSKLRYLNLNTCEFTGMIPHSLGNLSMLQFLDLRGNEDAYSNLDWLSRLQSLEYLHLSGLNLNEANTWQQTISNLPIVKEINMRDASLPSAIPTSLVHLVNASNSLVALDLSWNRMNFSSVFSWLLLHNNSLSYIDLSHSEMGGGFPDALKYLRSLSYLDLSYNDFEGLNILDALENLTRLSYLDLSVNRIGGSLLNVSRFPYLKEIHLYANHLNGSIEQDIMLPNLEVLNLCYNKLSGRTPNLSSCPHLRVINLENNMFNGTLSQSIGKLYKLEYLLLGSNQLEGQIFETHLFNLSNLQFLDLSFNSNLNLNVDFSNPLFQLDILSLASCNVGPHFPRWLQNQKHISELDMSNAKIMDTIPDWFWNSTRMPLHLNLSHNQIHGALPDWSSYKFSFQSLDLSFNQFSGTLPPMPPHVDHINLSRNKISGSINFCNFTSPLSGQLDLSNNQLSGHISPDCFMKLMGLSYLNLANNNLSGKIQTNTSHCSLFSLYMRNNSFSGYLPSSLATCRDLFVLDLGENKFHGKIPSWLGENMPNLTVLSLKSNKLYGSLLLSLCGLSGIQVFDISINKISGTIPKCFNNFTMLGSTTLQLSAPSTQNGSSFPDSASIIWKGQDVKYLNTLWLLKLIDLSSNNLSGDIPLEVTSLVELVALNLSRNNLIGSIPHNIGQLKMLNFLDLSYNNLSGSIPATLSQMSHLGVLDLSFNNLSGRIPFDTHMDTFETSSYVGNPRLCGPPLISKPCPEDDEMPKKTTDKVSNKTMLEDMLQNKEFYVSLVLGFSIAFWGVSWTLFLNKKWNVTIDKMLIHTEDWLYVKIPVNKRRFGSDR